MMKYTKNYYKVGDDGFLYRVTGGKERRVTSQAELDAWAKRHNNNGRFKMPLLRALRKDERQCEICGRIYRYKSNAQKFCSDCREAGYAETRRQYYLKIRRTHRDMISQSVKELTAATNNASQYSMTSRLGTKSDLGTFDEYMLDKKYDPRRWME